MHFIALISFFCTLVNDTKYIKFEMTCFFLFSGTLLNDPITNNHQPNIFHRFNSTTNNSIGIVPRHKDIILRREPLIRLLTREMDGQSIGFNRFGLVLN